MKEREGERSRWTFCYDQERVQHALEMASKKIPEAVQAIHRTDQQPARSSFFGEGTQKHSRTLSKGIFALLFK